MNIKKILALLLLVFSAVVYAQCTINAGGNQTICGTSATLAGSISGGATGTPTWTLVSKPGGATDPVISNINSYTPTVTGLNAPGNYVFKISQTCNDSSLATSQVTITAPGDVSTFTAGPDITNVNATTGTVTLNGVVPAGYTASWSAYNIYKWERSSIKNMQNAQFSSTTSATTTFSLNKKADHDIDPAYVVTLRITSTNNPNCYYEDTAIVRFIPNPQILPTVSTARCAGSNGRHWINLQSTSPVFSHAYSGSPNSSGNFGTTITMTANSQPTGANISYKEIYDGAIYLNGVTQIGTYKFTLTVSNSSGTYTTPELTYIYEGDAPIPPTFLVTSRPEQMMIYDTSGSGGEVRCNYAGLSTPITFLFTLDPSTPTSIITKTTTTGIAPPGGFPTVADGGAGTANRSATVTPPSGGWRVGTYKFIVNTRVSGASCNVNQTYYIHISDGARPTVSVPDATVCYPGSGSVTATVPLPAVYKGVVNTSYFQDFDGRYNLTLVSKPTGAANPVFEPYNNTLFTNTSTTISNLNKEGEYVFKIKADNYTSSVGAFLDKEYACSGTSLESTFKIYVSTQVNANAGSDQTLTGANQTTLSGNNPGNMGSTGQWTLVSKPGGAPNPSITNPSAYNTTVTNLITAGTYKFRWTIATGTCISFDEVDIVADGTPISYCVTGCNSNSYVNSSDPNTIEYDNMVSVFHSSMVKEFDGKVKVWGQGIAYNGSGGSTTGGNVTSLQELNNTNYPGLTGDILRFAAGSDENTQQFAVLTTDGLFVWGNSGVMVPLNSATNNVLSGNFRKAAVGTYNVSNGVTKADGLPFGVSPSDVKMMFGTRDGLAIVTCTGAAWVLSSNNFTYGDGASDSNANDIVWHRVSTATDTPLNNVVAVRGTYNTMMALTSTGDIYTWGVGTRINSGAATSRQYATLITKPAGVTPKMIGMTTSSGGKTYYLLSTTGELYAMGENNTRQLGNGSTTDSNTWVLVNGATSTVGSTTYTLGNIVWISPQEHEGNINNNYAAINVLTDDGKLWAWGSNSTGMLGGGSSNSTLNPTYMPGSITTAYNPGKLNLTDKLIAVETGGHTTLTIKQCTTKFGYVGHKIRGSMANDTEGTEQTYNYSDTAELAICGAVSAPIVKDLKICNGATANLANATSAALPSGATGINWWTDAAGTIPVANPLSVGPGTYYATYEGLTVKCPMPMTVSYYLPTDPGYNTCACMVVPNTTGTAKDTKVGITLLKRAGSQNTDNWPMVRKGGHIALESNTQGFVVTRIAKADLGNITKPQKGMMVYDTTDKCLKINTDGTATGWKCFNTPACPDNTFSISCSQATVSGDTKADPAVNFTITLPYVNGDGSSYPQQSFTSTDGSLTAVLSAGNLAIGAGNLILTVTGSPGNGGLYFIPITIKNNACTLEVNLTAPAGNT